MISDYYKHLERLTGNLDEPIRQIRITSSGNTVISFYDHRIAIQHLSGKCWVVKYSAGDIQDYYQISLDKPFKEQYHEYRNALRQTSSVQ